jgi:hypothetical protein
VYGGLTLDRFLCEKHVDTVLTIFPSQVLFFCGDSFVQAKKFTL